GYDPRPSGVPQPILLDRCRQCLRYLTRAHITGDLTCADGRKWGNHWQSSWWVSRMAAGAQLLWNHLSPDERAGVARVVAFEADRQGRRTPPGSAWGDTKSEENAWDTESLAWALALLPTHPNAPLWGQKLREFAANTLSVPADARNLALLEDKPVSHWVKSANVHDDFTIENHGAYHFCYMACPLHSLAWSYYALTTSRRAVPPHLWHHYRDVWNVLARTFLPDGRFAYLSGKDWPRYAYGLSFILPVTVVMQLEFGAPEARLFERARIAALEREQILNGDGTFFGRRFTRNQMADRLLEYETDTYALVGLSYLLRYRAHTPVPSLSLEAYLQRASGAWHSPDCGFCVARWGNVFTSFSWRTLSGRAVQGLFVPADASLAEWGADQFAGSLAVKGYNMNHPRRVTHNDCVEEERFITVGAYDEGDRGGQSATVHYLAFAGLPRERVAAVLERIVAADRITVTRNEGVRFYLPNDLFNGNTRVLLGPGTRRRIAGVEPTRKEARQLRLDVPWLNVDGVLGFAQVGTPFPFVVYDVPARNAPWGSLLTESLVTRVNVGEENFSTGDVVRQTAYVLVAGDAAATRRAARSELTHAPALGKDAMVMRLRCPGGAEYYIGANFGVEPARATVNTGGDWGVPVTLSMAPLSGVIARVPLSRW
ncbi:MAG: hypothetical protein QHJ73_13530, partial [Armatimonadota bacterium]|nr:hypothetical protein [Armatimonadota bacterium]